MFLISVIIPNYNHSKFLTQRIDSVLNQTYQNFELIILDDCSTDNSKAIIEGYRFHPKVSHIAYNNQNSASTFMQWQKGFSLAKGNLIWIAESDDYCELNFLETLVQPFIETADLAISYCASYKVNEHNEKTGIMKMIRGKEMGKWYINNGENEVLKYFIYGQIIPNASAVLFKKECLRQVSPTFMQYKICGDWQFWLDICCAGSIAYYYTPLNYFRRVEYFVDKPGFNIQHGGKLLFLESLQVGYYAIKQHKVKMNFLGTMKYTYAYQKSTLHSIFRKQFYFTIADFKQAYRWLLKINPLSFIFLPVVCCEAGYLLIMKYIKKL